MLGEKLSSKQRAELSANIDSLIEQGNEAAGLSGATACKVNPENSDKVGLQVKEDNVGIIDVEVIDVYCK